MSSRSPNPMHLGRRERQIMEIVYAKGAATANDVLAALPDPPSRTSVRTMMRILEEKGHLVHRQQGKEFIYRPTRPRGQVAKSALRSLLGTFFAGSLEKAVAAYLADPKTELSPDELERLNNVIANARRKGV